MYGNYLQFSQMTTTSQRQQLQNNYKTIQHTGQQQWHQQQQHKRKCRQSASNNIEITNIRQSNPGAPPLYCFYFVVNRLCIRPSNNNNISSSSNNNKTINKCASQFIGPNGIGSIANNDEENDGEKDDDNDDVDVDGNGNDDANDDMMLMMMMLMLLFWMVFWMWIKLLLLLLLGWDRLVLLCKTIKIFFQHEKTRKYKKFRKTN